MYPKQPKSSTYNQMGGGLGLVMSDPNKAALIKKIMEKEKRGWIRAMPIALVDGSHVIRMTYGGGS